LGTGFNTQTTGKDFYKDAQGGKTDWLGIDDGTRALPASYTTKSNFDTIGITDGNIAAKANIGKQMRNSWSPLKKTAPLNSSVQFNGGFTSKFLTKKIGGSFGLSYNKNYKYLDLLNRNNNLNSTGVFGITSSYDDSKYTQETTVGGLASLSVQLNSLNKISGKVLINVNNTNSVVNRLGYDTERPDTLQKGVDFTFKQNTFFTGQLNGEHALTKTLKLKWYGAFNILDGYIPDQRRLTYGKLDPNPNVPYEAVIGNTLSQKSGSRVYQSLSDYIYTGGTDATYSFNAWGNKHSLKGGYMFQIKDRLYDAQLFAIYLPNRGDLSLKKLLPNQIFAPENFGNGLDTKFGFDAIKNKNFRYMANTILNAGFLQLDNQLGKNLRAVWGLRVENYDQLIGSVKTYDPRHLHTNQTDFLPGANFTYKLNNKTNIRLSGSQTVIRPELRELASLSLYDFELNASVNGDPNLKQTKIINTDLRYELYPRAGEVLSAGVFYKNFKNPIEQFYNEDGGGSFSFVNPSKAYSYGIELEFRKKLDFISSIKNFTFQSNVSLIKSNVKDTLLGLNRPLQGQSNYVINAGLLYDLEKYGLSATALFNMIGRRIYVTGGVSAFSGTPNIWELPRPLLDFQIAKKVLAKKGEVKLNISDIINQKQVFYQNNTTNGNFEFDKTKDAYRFTRINGTTFSITFNYSL
jgi:Outer membrane protein beta-barrel family